MTTAPPANQRRVSTGDASDDDDDDDDARSTCQKGSGWLALKHRRSGSRDFEGEEQCLAAGAATCLWPPDLLFRERIVTLPRFGRVLATSGSAAWLIAGSPVKFHNAPDDGSGSRDLGKESFVTLPRVFPLLPAPDLLVGFVQNRR
ncbi:hypothetical protein BHM03_00043224 [Ensete ventricosum]|nr:hypothetical protein BHM03_00043224 [Ensete ventricosum]